MGTTEREAFLSVSRSGVLSISEPDGGVISSPVWFLYEPGSDLTFHLNDPSLKLAAIDRVGRATLSVQDEGDIEASGRPPRYVSVTGPIVENRPFDMEVDGDEIWSAIKKYLGDEIGRRYLALGAESFLTGDPPGMPRVVRLRPERWFTRDYGKGGDRWDELVGTPGASAL